MKKIILISIFFFLYGSKFSFSQTDSIKKDALVWQTDLLKAQELSKSTNKPIFALFTGSDWCIWCHKLQKDVFEKSQFKEWAQKNVILLELDFPRKKQLPPDLSQQNSDLQKTFNVQGYPTVWMFYMTGDEVAKKFTISALGSLGYPQNAISGKEEVMFLNNANSILTNKVK